VQFRDNRNVPAVVYESGQSSYVGLQIGCAHLTDCILSIKIRLSRFVILWSTSIKEGIQYNGGLTVSLPVSDLDAAIDWYQEILGFELKYRLDDIGWCELTSSVKNVNVGLSVVETPNPGGATPTFGVQDIEAAAATLQAKDVRIDGDIVTIDGLVRLLMFYDQDNNALMLYQELASDA